MSKTRIVAEKGKQQIVVTRIFDSSRELVFNTYLDPDSVPDWWGPRIVTTTVDKMEVRKGGIWRFVQQAPDGQIHAHNGVYHEVLSPERIVNTYEYEGYPGIVGLVTTMFEELPGGKTKFLETTLYPSEEVREAVIQSGMYEGVIELLDRLEEILAKLQS
ncbi:SRPBCC family protein [Paenibacillaceae bacterium WGS1546]|uniref:SRPBCC family protein n=1 Tax=Cohnella sp. WGS1546 TaxID=3366810 RepID=UPI00372D0540